MNSLVVVIFVIFSKHTTCVLLYILSIVFYVFYEYEGFFKTRELWSLYQDPYATSTIKGRRVGHVRGEGLHYTNIMYSPWRLLKCTFSKICGIAMYL